MMKVTSMSSDWASKKLGKFEFEVSPNSIDTNVKDKVKDKIYILRVLVASQRESKEKCYNYLQDQISAFPEVLFWLGRKGELIFTF